MYRIRIPGYSKQDPVQRWQLPDRIFFACGACHILAYAFLERYGTMGGLEALWLKPAPGHIGNHIFIAHERGWVFDFHGYAERARFMQHTFRRARHFWPGWDATLQALPPEVLVSEAKSKSFEGLWLREPDQFLHNALPRARRFLDRFPKPDFPNSVDQGATTRQSPPAALTDWQASTAARRVAKGPAWRR